MRSIGSLFECVDEQPRLVTLFGYLYRYLLEPVKALRSFRADLVTLRFRFAIVQLELVALATGHDAFCSSLQVIGIGGSVRTNQRYRRKTRQFQTDSKCNVCRQTLMAAPTEKMSNDHCLLGLRQIGILRHLNELRSNRNLLVMQDF
jgi:hypothetical protein